MGRVYQIRITYKLGKLPQSYVLDPSIGELAGGRKIPHLYSQDEQKLCLFYPRHGEWNETMWLSASIVPWVSTWLFYFEEWLVSDDWKGGGIHPG